MFLLMSVFQNKPFLILFQELSNVLCPNYDKIHCYSKERLKFHNYQCITMDGGPLFSHIMTFNFVMKILSATYIQMHSRKGLYSGSKHYEPQGTKIFKYCTCPAGLATYNFHSSCKHMHMSFKSVCHKDHK